MQPDTDPIPVSPGARDYILRFRPELAGMPLTRKTLLAPAQNPPAAQFSAPMVSDHHLLGNRLTAAFERTGIAYLVHLLTRGRPCGCARRADWLNRHGLAVELSLWITTGVLWSVWLLL